MSSTSEKGYGARIGNAEKLITALESFSNYQPRKPELSIAVATTQINAIKERNDLVAAKKQTHALAIENRIQLFEKSSGSIKRILSPINATVKVSFGRNTKEEKIVANIIQKMRGQNIKKTSSSDGNTISQSYQSFNSKTQFLADLIVVLTDYGTNYNPSNPDLSIIALKTLYNNAVASNLAVMESYTQFALINDLRINDYLLLTQIAVRIKDSVKAQYGQASVEYKLIKGLKI